ncbi:MAG: selenium metabolism-associated LysR family transcriptional regulator [Pseudomonadota bacterium]
MEFDFRQIEAFCKVVELGGFTRAAQALHLAQASVSERIANLEAALDTKLLDRLGRSVVPTKAGELLYGHAIDLLAQKRNVELKLEAFLGRWKGTIRIGGSTVPGNYILPCLLSGFRQEYPEVVVDLTIGDSDGIASLVSEGVLELGFVGSVQSTNGLESRTLWGDELVLVVPTGHRWCAGGPVTLAEISGEPLILREAGSGTQQSLLADLGGALGGDALNIACILGSSDAVKEGVRCGLGVAFISSRAIRTEVSAGLLETVEVEGLRLTRHVHLVSDPRRARSPLCKALTDFVLSRLPAGDHRHP